MSNGRTADPLNEHAVRLKELTKKRIKNLADHKAIAEVEFDAALYFSKEIGLYFPSAAFQKMLLQAAKTLKLGRQISGVLVVDVPGPALVTPGHKSLDALRKDASIHFRTTVVQSSSTVAKVRPMFPPGWKMDFTVEFQPDEFDLKPLVEIVHIAGRRVGLGNWRPSAPKSPGNFGKFVLEDTVVQEGDIAP